MWPCRPRVSRNRTEPSRTPSAGSSGCGKAVPPPGRAREDLEILADILERLGLPQADRTGAGVFAELARLAPQYAGMSWNRLENGGLQWPCPSPDHPGTPILHVERFTRGLGRFVPLRWNPPAEDPGPEYPLILTTGRNIYQYHTRTMTGREEGLSALAGEAYAELHPRAADQAGVSHGQLLRLSTRRGSIELTARVSEGIRPDTVFVPFHYAEAAANILTGTALDPYAKIPELKVCAVRAEGVKPPGSCPGSPRRS